MTGSGISDRAGLRREGALLARRQKSRLRCLLSTVAASGLTAAAAFPAASQAQTVVPPANGPCAVNGTVATCTGDVSAGVQANAPLTTLNVNSLTQNIAPAAGTNGIEFDVTADQNISVNSNTGPFQIVTTTTGPTNGYGIRTQLAGNGNITVSSTGSLLTGNDSIWANVTSATGTPASGNGNIEITTTGNIVSTNGNGVLAAIDDGDGNITITSTGDVTVLGNGIIGYAANNGNINVSSVGNVVAAYGNGIFGTVYTGDGNVNINSTGNITAADDGIYGNVGNDGNVSITNRGDIFSAIEEGIDAEVGNIGNIVINTSGTINSDDEAIDATIRNSGNITITNTGNLTSIDGAGIDAYIANSGDVSIINHADISAAEEGIYARVTDGTITIINTGSVISTGTNAAFDSGIDVGPGRGVAPATITNSGLIRGASGFAINLRSDGNDVVNLRPGSIIEGAIDFGNGNDGMGGTNPNDIDTLNFAAGLNATVDFADSGGAGQGDTDFQSAPEIINFASAGVVVNGGLTAVAVDATGFALQGTFVSDLTNAILNSIDNGGGVRRRGTDLISTHGAADTGEERTDNSLRVWGSAFGGYHDVEAEGRLVPFDHNFWGLLTGLETGDVEVNGVFGLLGGYGDSRLTVSYDAGETEIDSYFGGLYYKREFGSYRVHAAFLAGATDNKVIRTVNGLDAHGDFDGLFYSPSLTVAKPIDLFAVPMSVSARANYVYMHLDGYTETGIALPLTVDDRTVSLFNARAQINFPRFFEHSGGNATRVNLAIGLDATLDAGSDEVGAAVAGVPFSFGGDTEDEVGAFVGINVAHSWGNGRHTVGFDGELQSTFDGGVEATGGLRASFRF